MASNNDPKERLKRVTELVEREARAGNATTVNLLLAQLPHHYPQRQPLARRRSAQRDIDRLIEDGTLHALDGEGRELRVKPVKIELLPPGERLLRGITRDHVRDLVQGSLLKRSLEKLWPELMAPEKGIALGQDKVCMVSDTQRLVAAEFKEDVLTAVLEALAVARSLVIFYRDAKGEASQREVHPLGLMQRGPRLYLWAWRPDVEDSLRMYALHRVVTAALGEQSAEPMPGFSLQARIQGGQADFASGESIVLVLRVRRYVADLLRDCPLCDTQRIEEEEAGSPFEARVYANVPSTGQLLRWLLGCGDNIEVLEPASLRGTLAAQAAKMSALYTATPAEAPALAT